MCLCFLPNPPAWASMIEMPTGVSSMRPSSADAFAVNPSPQGDPGGLISFPISIIIIHVILKAKNIHSTFQACMFFRLISNLSPRYYGYNSFSVHISNILFSLIMDELLPHYAEGHQQCWPHLSCCSYYQPNPPDQFFVRSFHSMSLGPDCQPDIPIYTPQNTGIWQIK